MNPNFTVLAPDKESSILSSHSVKFWQKGEFMQPSLKVDYKEGAKFTTTAATLAMKKNFFN